jgi:hypothetical protein
VGKNELMVLQSLVQLLKDQPPGGSKPAFARSALHESLAVRTPSPAESPGPSLAEDHVRQASWSDASGPSWRRQGVAGREKLGERGASPAATKPAAARANLLQNRDLMYETIAIVENNLRIVQDMLVYAEKVESSVSFGPESAPDLMSH